ncbi:MAG: undecaprenyl-phosphate glucose phosphotransferase [Deltaproteobacteria bacterium]|nr:undecaprenyl-phosphate glucose phosphotransferase [Deltaproteobacteria bacterium]MCB9488467.1 undecaprenyl-phosphate glucose phosphotransferase [Deltaproteobacteria bacterium]
MISRRLQFIGSLVFLADLIVVAASWLVAYPIRFNLGLIPLTVQHIPPFSLYAWMTLLALLIWTVVFRTGNLFDAKTIPSVFRELTRLVRSHILAFTLYVVVTFFLAQYKPSRIVFGLFFVLSLAGMVGVHLASRAFVMHSFRRGQGVRKVLVVGTGDLGRELAGRINRHRELGLSVVGFLSDKAERAASVDDIPVLGAPEDVQRVIEEMQIDSVFVALPLHQVDRLRKVLEALGEEMVDVKVVPDLYQYVTLRAGVEEFEGLPIISLKDTPLYGWRAVGKRIFDFTASLVGLIVLSPLLIGLAIAVKLTSPGPVFYRQERMGLDGRTFNILKYRSMRVNAEASTGAVWAVKDDPRRTRLGTFMRRTNLDELPQLLNVLAGHMSLVGPRPERPVFIDKFRSQIPKYMLRHKVKAGITGWAQANGWRGDTDLTRRIECDIYYIENWSFWLDLRILWMTLAQGFTDKNAY